MARALGYPQGTWALLEKTDGWVTVRVVHAKMKEFQTSAGEPYRWGSALGKGALLEEEGQTKGI